MSSPYVAGTVALYFEKHGKVHHDVLRTVLQNSASPVSELDLPDYKSSAARQGAGMVQIDRAIEQDFLVSPSNLAIGLKSQTTQTFTVKNLSSKKRKFAIHHEFAVAANAANLDQPILRTYPSKVSFSRKRVNVAGGGGQETFDVTISPNAKFQPNDHWVYSGFITVVALGENNEPTEKVASIPFAGYSGNWLSRPIFSTKTPYFNIQPSDGNSSKTPQVDFEKQVFGYGYSLSLATREISFYLYDAKTGKNLGLISKSEPMGRNMAGTYNGFEWADGLLFDGTQVQPGSYQLQLSALKTPADPRQESSYETLNSPTFTILKSKKEKSSTPSKESSKDGDKDIYEEEEHADSDSVQNTN
jgi:hypothetical protein